MLSNKTHLTLEARRFMSHSAQKKFYSYLPLLRFYARFTAICSAIFGIAAIFGQGCSGHFSAYQDLAFAALIPVVAFAVIAILILLSDYLYPLTVTKTGLQCYNSCGNYCSITWDEIIAIEEGSRFGLKCLYLNVNAFNPIIVPLWLHNLDNFYSAVEHYAGKNNPLTIALTESTQYKS
jgi:hypothetical protein